MREGEGIGAGGGDVGFFKGGREERVREIKVYVKDGTDYVR